MKAPASTGRTARRIALAAFLVFAVTGGGRIVGSDELAMLDLARSMLHGSIVVPEGATVPGPGGRLYTKGAPEQALLALPLVATAEAAARVAGLDPARRTLAVRFVASFFNAIVTALLLGVFYASARGLSVGAGGAFAGTLLLGFTTPLWVYAKSFMAEPLQALGLLLALEGAARAGESPVAPRRAALGALLAISAKLSMLPLALAALVPLLAAPRRTWRWPALGVALALAGHAAWNLARFGSPLETGYGVQATAAAYTTPILVGLYGLLLSSGKGVLWFAPALFLAPAGFRALRREGGAPARRAAWGAAAVAAVALGLYARFEHWAGDGSFGPRYLLPVLPLAFLAVARALDRARGARRALAAALAVAGLVVQVGGVSIYFGAEMREVGDYPYQLPLEDPRSLSDSHFNPAFSPIAVQLRMLGRNLSEHLRGEAPRISTADHAPGRSGLAPADEARLLHALDFWWAYLTYAGFPRLPVALAALALAALAVATAGWSWAAWRAESAAAGADG